MKRTVSRREFARASVAMGAAVALPNGLLAETVSPNVATVAARSGAEAAAKRRLMVPPPAMGYGGEFLGAEYRDSISLAHAPAAFPGGQAAAPAVIRGWQEATTIPAEYYIGERHYESDEQDLAEHFWFMVDHESRIPKPGDYFVFEFGRGDSLIVLRDTQGQVKAYHNVCRHRGSRLCRHADAPVPTDVRLSVKQLMSTGNTPVFRCPYHAWTYDLTGSLISVPNGMPADFDKGEYGLHPAHLQTVEGLIFVNLSRQDPPEFESFVKTFRAVAQDYGTARLKVGARISYPTRANWKLALENFQECYHCGPAHRALVKTHPFWDGQISNEMRSRLEQQLERYAPPPQTLPAGTPGQGGQGMGNAGTRTRFGGGALNVGFVTGSVDGRPVAPLLPNFKEEPRRSRITNTGFMTSNLQCYDDYVAAVRFTPRDVMMTDVEIVWLVRADAKEGKDYRLDRLTALWDITMHEDKWIVENNHLGIKSGRYQAGRYAMTEGGPARLVKWYMGEVATQADRQSSAG